MLTKILDFSKTSFLFVDTDWMFCMSIGNTAFFWGCSFFQDESKKAAYDSGSPFEEI